MRNTLFIIAMVVAGFFGATVAVRTYTPGISHTQETAFERVMRTNTLRCGYGIWAPGLTKDAQTGQLGGIFYDYLNAIGQHTGIKIEWASEVGWGDFPAALNSGRIDAMCFGAWPKAQTAKEVLFTKSVYTLPIRAYVRADDTRFDGQLAKANDPAITIATMDSELSSQIAAAQFSAAKTLSVPQLSDAATLLLNVATSKADITFTDAWTASLYMQKNPGQIKAVTETVPLRQFGHTIPVALGEQNLVALLNAATDEMLGNGEMDAIIAKHSTIPGVLITEKALYK